MVVCDARAGLVHGLCAPFVVCFATASTYSELLEEVERTMKLMLVSLRKLITFLAAFVGASPLLPSPVNMSIIWNPLGPVLLPIAFWWTTPSKLHSLRMTESESCQRWQGRMPMG